MPKEMLVSVTSLETRLAIIEDGQVTELFIERPKNKSILGNIYKGRVTRVLPGMQAAFVDIGLERNAFLYVADFFQDYAEYEELFSETEKPADEFLEEEQELPLGRNPAATGGRIATRGRAQPRKKTKAPTQVAPLNTVWQRGSAILPDRISIVGDFGEAASAALNEPPRNGILPDLLAPAWSETEKREESTAFSDREVRLNNACGPYPLAASRSRSRRRPRNDWGENPLIGDLLKEGQEILVQIAKEPIGRKGARITSHIVLPGRYVVFMPTVDHIGISRKIQSANERLRLKKIMTDLKSGFPRGFIVRTAGENKSETEFRQDMLYLTRLWEEVRVKSEKSKAPSLIHAELNLVQRVIRDFFYDDYRAIRIDDPEELNRVREFVAKFNPDFVSRIKLHNKKAEIFDFYNVNSEIEKALRSRVWLKNGGHIVINQTEALVAIDVNTGKYVGSTNSLEDTITKTNLDAVKEVVRQIRLRDLGGIIVIDFIDMDQSKNRARVMEALQQELGRDKAPSKILQFNEFGLVAITRKRVKQSLERILCQPCIYCDGSGLTKSVRTVCFSLYNEVRRMKKSLKKGKALIIYCHPEVAQALGKSEKNVLDEIARLTGMKVSVESDSRIHLEKFELVER